MAALLKAQHFPNGLLKAKYRGEDIKEKMLEFLAKCYDINNLIRVLVAGAKPMRNDLASSLLDDQHKLLGSEQYLKKSSSTLCSSARLTATLWITRFFISGLH